MTTNALLVTFYAIVAVAVLLLLVRYFRRRSQEKRELERLQQQQLRTHSPDSATGESESLSARAAEGTYQPARHGTTQTTTTIPVSSLPVNPPGGSGTDYFFGALTPALAALLPESETRRQEIQKELVQAGYYQPQAYQNLAAGRYLGIMLGLIVFGTLLVLVPRPLEGMVLVMLVVFPVMAWALPRLYVKNKATQRKNRIEHAMPDLLDMLNMCVSQGLIVPKSLERISRDLKSVYPDMAQELQILSEHTRLGSLPQALDSFRNRIDVPEVHSFASLIIQTEQMGTSVSEALMEHSENMRESMRQRSDEKANQASFKLLFPTVLCLMPAVLMFLLGPAVIELSNFFNEGGSDVLTAPTEMIQQLRINSP